MTSAANVPIIKWECRFCGDPLPIFAIKIQLLLLGSDVIDWCRKCSAREAHEGLDIMEV